jgi:ATP-dependent DNA ligase
MREFRFEGKKSQPLVWKISQQGTKYTTEHGMLGGAMQTFSDIPGDKGKVGTKGYVTAEDNCVFHIEREIRKKLEHGYVEYIDGKPSQEQVNEIIFTKALPKNFCGYKPQTSIEDAALEKLHKSGKARYTRKYDGMCHLAVHHPTGWEIYTRRMDLSTERFPLHLEALSKTSYEIGTILVGEMVCVKSDTKEDFKAISRICRSLPEESRKLILECEVPEPQFIIFDILFHNGKDLKNTCYDERAKLWKGVNLSILGHENKTLIRSIDYFNLTPQTWQKYAKDHGWEGFVVTDGSSIPGDKFYSFDGDAKRPKGHHKLKPIYEDDVVVFAAAAGSGKRLNGIGAVYVKQLHPETKKWMYCGKVGSGFTDEDLAELEKIWKDKKYPIFSKDKDAEKFDINQDDGLVIMIEYGERQPGTQKFRFPVFCRIRTDKSAKECVAQRLAPEEE